MGWNNSTGWNKEKQKARKDSFWLGFIPGLLLPITIILILVKQNTERSIWYILPKLGLILHNMGMHYLMIGIIPTLVLFFVFYILKKERAVSGAFVGVVPYIVLLFWLY